MKFSSGAGCNDSMPRKSVKPAPKRPASSTCSDVRLLVVVPRYPLAANTPIKAVGSRGVPF
jgi:hypothetical protein